MLNRRNPAIDRFEKMWGIKFDGAVDFLPKEWRTDFNLAADAAPALITAVNGGIPAWLATMIDPNTYDVLSSPNAGAEILGETKAGDWTTDTMVFPAIEYTGQVSSYGDENNNGTASANPIFPARQSYLYQVIPHYGDREIDRMGLMKLDWAAKKRHAATLTLDKFANYTYHFGVAGLQNYGLLNDPQLTAALTPATKAATGTRWTNAGTIMATANEVYADIQALFAKVVAQSGGNVKTDAKMVLVVPPESAVGLTATNSFGIGVEDLIKKNFPNIRIVQSVLYGSVSASNPQGVSGGNVAQLIVEEVEGQETGYCAFNEKLHAHPIVRRTSSYVQKMTQGTWGAIIRNPWAIAQMVGI